MIGSWRWNALASIACAALIFILAWRTNPLLTAAYRSGAAFAVVFLVTFAVRWMLGQALRPPPPAETDETPEAPEERGEAPETKGARIDMATPADDEDAFTPLTPSDLTKLQSQLNPELLAKALRTMSDK